MASGKEINPDDLPPEIQNQPISIKDALRDLSWQEKLNIWVKEQLNSGRDNILHDAQMEFEKIMLEQALKYTHGHKQDAAKRLGWGRNTITRKLKELGISP